jgi:hypothetical protein
MVTVQHRFWLTSGDRDFFDTTLKEGTRTAIFSSAECFAEAQRTFKSGLSRRRGIHGGGKDIEYRNARCFNHARWVSGYVA